MKNGKSYRELNKELEDIIYQLDGEHDDIDKAVDLYQKAEGILQQIDKYLKETKKKIDAARDKPRR